MSSDNNDKSSQQSKYDGMLGQGLLSLIKCELRRLNRQRVAVPDLSSDEERHFFVTSTSVVLPGRPVSVQDLMEIVKWLQREETTAEVVDKTLARALQTENGRSFSQAIQNRSLVGNDGKPYSEDEDGNRTSDHGAPGLQIAGGSAKTSPAAAAGEIVGSALEAPGAAQQAQNTMVFLESPYSKRQGSMESQYNGILRNIRYLQWCNLDSTARGELPVCSHMSMTMHPMCEGHWVSDYIPQYNLLTREGAIERAHQLRAVCSKTVFYVDRGWSKGMKAAKQYCLQNDIAFEVRNVDYNRIVRAFPNIQDFVTSRSMLPSVIDDNCIHYQYLFPERNTLAIIKPDAKPFAGKIEHIALINGLQIHLSQVSVLSRQYAENFYQQHRGKPYFQRLIDSVTAGPVTFLWLQSDETVKKPCWEAWRELCGPTDPAVAKKEAPGSIRALYGKELPFNAVHGSDSILSAQRELKMVFEIYFRSIC